MVYKRVRGWTSGRSLPVLNFVKYPLPPSSFPLPAGDNQPFLLKLPIFLLDRRLPLSPD